MTNPIAFIQAGETPRFHQAIVNVEATEGHISRAGFNPRPEKIAPRLLFELGTVSKHGTGNATDIDDQHNPALSSAQWAHIEAITGLTVDRSAQRWKTDPSGLWQDISDISAAFAALNYTAEIAKLTQARANKELIQLHQKWAGGFFTLSQSLVVALHQQGMVWGATFNNQVDLHHFELP